jgi:N-acetyl-alpha-D-muramate 1-phosphate uridylyltransferase
MRRSGRSIGSKQIHFSGAPRSQPDERVPQSPRLTLPTICILAGGLGQRLGERTARTPKPLVQVAGEPFLIHQLRLLAEHGADRVVLCVGYLGEMIEERIGPKQYGIGVDYSYDSPELDGTLGAIRRALPLLGQRFLILYGDTYLRLDYEAAAADWIKSDASALMTVLRNEGRWDTSNVVYADGHVLEYDKRHLTSDMHWIDYGLGGLKSDALGAVDEAEGDLAVLYQRLAQSGSLFGYLATERFYEIGTPAGLAETEAFLRATSA